MFHHKIEHGDHSEKNGPENKDHILKKHFYILDDFDIYFIQKSTILWSIFTPKSRFSNVKNLINS